MRVREFYDADRNEGFELPTRNMTSMNKHGIHCGVCGEKFFLDDASFAHFNNVVEKSLENPFVCELCAIEYDEIAHSA